MACGWHLAGFWFSVVLKTFQAEIWGSNCFYSAGQLADRTGGQRTEGPVRAQLPLGFEAVRRNSRLFPVVSKHPCCCEPGTRKMLSQRARIHRIHVDCVVVQPNAVVEATPQHNDHRGAVDGWAGWRRANCQGCPFCKPCTSHNMALLGCYLVCPCCSK